MREEQPVGARQIDDEIAALVRQLHETQQRLQDLAGGEVDAILQPAGQPYLLQQAQEQLRLSEMALRGQAETQSSILNSLPAQVALLDRDGVIISVNESWGKFSRENAPASPGDWVGQNYLEVCQRAVGPGSTEARAAAAGISAILSGSSGKEFLLEYPCHSPAGKAWFLLRVNPIAKGGRGGAVVMHTNITERKLSEAALRQREELLGLITDLVPLGIFVKDSAGRHIFANPALAEIAGLSVNEIIGKSDFDLVTDRAQAEAYRADDEAVIQSGRKKFIEEEPRTDLSGRTRFLQTIKVPYKVSATGESAVLGVCMDITEQKQALNALQESEERFRGVFNSAGTGIATSTPEGRYLQANAAYCSMLGYTEEELKARDFASVTHPDDLAHNLEIRDEVLAGKRDSFVMEKRYLRKDGKIIWTRHSVAPVRRAGGEVVLMIVVAEDITERLAAERDSAAQIKLMEMAGAIAKLGAWALEYPGSKIIWSKEVYRIHEVGPEVNQDLESALSFYPPLSRERLNQAILKGEPYDLELDFITAKGKKLRIRTTSEVERQNGVARRFFGIFQDVTEQNRMAARFRRLVESNAQGVIFYHANGRIIEANDAFLGLVGFSREELANGELDWSALTPPEYAALDRRALEQIAAKGSCVPYEKEYVRRDGSRVPILLGAAAFEDDPEEGVCFVLDLTENKKLEQQFLRAQRVESIGTLAGGIAHDMNNVLAPIMMSVEFLKSTNTDEGNLKLLETLRNSAQRGADLVKQLLSFARGMDGQRVIVDLVHILKELLKVMKDTFPKNIQPSFKCGANLWNVIGDPTQLHQIFLNLCVNARDAMPDGGSLSVKLENAMVDETFITMNPGASAGPYVKAQVEDTGSGIPSAIRERIFEPFFTTKGQGKGTGLGLSSTMAIIKSHGGFIHLESEMGKGTKFDVYLPADTSGKAAEKAAGPPELLRGNGEMVLVVDDEEAIRLVTTETLLHFGYRVLLAKHGAEAVALYAQHRQEIAVVLTDMMMPIMDGPALIVALKAMDPQVLIVGSSGRSSDDGVSRALRAGVHFFIPKPYTAEAMLEILHKALRWRSAK